MTTEQVKSMTRRALEEMDASRTEEQYHIAVGSLAGCVPSLLECIERLESEIEDLKRKPSVVVAHTIDRVEMS